MEDSSLETKKNPFKILAIDDSKDILAYIRVILEAEDFYVKTYTNAKIVTELKKRSFDAVLLDLSMPEMNGREFLEWFRKDKRNRRIPVIILTAEKKSPDIITSIFNLGANDYMQKPFTREELTARIKTHIKLKRALDELTLKNISLKRELEKHKQHHKISDEYSTIIEKTLLQKIEKLYEDTKYHKNKMVEVQEENKIFKNRIEDLKILCDTIVSHDSVLEDELSVKLTKVTEKAEKDQLTNIFNRVKFYDILYKEIKNFKANTINDLSIIMFDIDHFKSINDNYGHDVGDYVLKDMTIVVSNALIMNTSFYRWGGEEFIILVPGKDMVETIGLAEKIREDIASHAFKHIGTLTCSFGVAEYNDDEEEVFLKRVDNALYKAKDSGRNCVKT